MAGVSLAPNQFALPPSGGKADVAHSLHSTSAASAITQSQSKSEPSSVKSRSLQHSSAEIRPVSPAPVSSTVSSGIDSPSNRVSSTSSSAAQSNSASQFSLQQGALSVDGLVNVSQTPAEDDSGTNSNSSGAPQQQTEPDAAQVEQGQASGVNTEESSDTEDSDQRDQQQAERQDAAKEQQAKQELDALAKRDAEVRAHEQAHAAVGGQYAGAPSYSYEQGSDGKRYAVDGEVQIDVSPIANDPQATVNKMQKVYAAAMAPVQPSMADIQVANEAMRTMNQAKAELASDRSEQLNDANSANELQDSIENPFAGNFFDSQIDDQGNITYQPASDEPSPFADAIDSINVQVNRQQAESSPNEIQRFAAEVLSSRYEQGAGQTNQLDLLV
ncbi:putative metalloprotease CJM1_0395 family protein [Shewanella waksmanii]|uniref:putative metalloprotease CJM1_0395 family protein n=1 Tax=Shewanella waksmanii TaxID=213783 RepID=UPI003734F402